jgi:hypothetical protein
VVRSRRGSLGIDAAVSNEASLLRLSLAESNSAEEAVEGVAAPEGHENRIRSVIARRAHRMAPSCATDSAGNTLPRKQMV